MKQCSECGMIKDWEEFYRSSHTRDGLQYRCKDCDKARWRSRSRPVDRARMRALHRLARAFPKEYSKLLREEIAKGP